MKQIRKCMDITLTFRSGFPASLVGSCGPCSGIFNVLVNLVGVSWHLLTSFFPSWQSSLSPDTAKVPLGSVITLLPRTSWISPHFRDLGLHLPQSYEIQSSKSSHLCRVRIFLLVFLVCHITKNLNFFLSILISFFYPELSFTQNSPISIAYLLWTIKEEKKDKIIDNWS